MNSENKNIQEIVDEYDGTFESFKKTFKECPNYDCCERIIMKTKSLDTLKEVLVVVNDYDLESLILVQVKKKLKTITKTVIPTIWTICIRISDYENQKWFFKWLRRKGVFNDKSTIEVFWEKSGWKEEEVLVILENFRVFFNNILDVGEFQDIFMRCRSDEVPRNIRRGNLKKTIKWFMSCAHRGYDYMSDLGLTLIRSFMTKNNIPLDGIRDSSFLPEVRFVTILLALQMSLDK